MAMIHPIRNPHPLQFKNLEVMLAPYYFKNPILCPVCQGHGMYNYQILADGRCYQASCGQCNGHGYVEDYGKPICVHEWDNETIIGHCLRSYTCVHCGATKQVDSSD